MTASKVADIAFTEVLANLRAGTWRTVLVIATAIVLGFLCTTLTSLDASAIQDQWTHVEVAGRSTYIATGNGGVLTATQCDAASSLDGVVSAGGVLSQTTVTSPASPGYSFGLIRATPGFAAAVWVANVSRSHVVAGPEVASHFGLSGGRFVSLAVANEPFAVLKVNDSMTAASRLADADNAIVVPTRTVGVVAACYVRVAPATRQAAGHLIQSYFGDGIAVSSALTPTELVINPDTAFAQRTSNWYGVTCGLILLALELVVIFGRREAFALYRVVGLQKNGLLAMLSIEVAVIVVLPFQSGAFWGTLLAVHTSPIVATAVLIENIKALSATTLTPLCGLLILDRISPVAAFRGY